MKKKSLLSLTLSTSPYQEFINRIIEFAKTKESKYTCVANVHMLVEGHKDPAFASIVNNADIITPDGKPLTWGLRLIHGIKQDRVAGMFLMHDLLKAAEEKGLPVLFYGSTEPVMRTAKRFLSATYPELKVAGLISPPFRELKPEEEEAYITRINKSGARIVFVALGCPKQEKWMAKMKGRINAMMVGVGAALPVLIGMRKKAPMWIQNGGLEWLFRLCLEPKRLFRRYAVTNTTFLYLLGKEVVKVRLLKKEPASGFEPFDYNMN